MFRILLIRHGSTDVMRDVLCGRTPGVPLNAEGRKQAATLGEVLRQEVSLAAVYSSPLERTVETARLIADPQGLIVSVESRLNEVDFGNWMGLSFDELRDRSEWQNYNAHRALRSPPGGESLAAVQARVQSCLQTMQQIHPNETIAAVSHGDVIRTLIMLLLGIPLDHVLRLQIDPGSVSEVHFEGGMPTLRNLNRTFQPLAT